MSWHVLCYSQSLRILSIDHLCRCVDLLVKLVGEDTMALGLQEHICRVSLHMRSLASLKVRSDLEEDLHDCNGAWDGSGTASLWPRHSHCNKYPPSISSQICDLQTA
jgi:hypothetical protein